MKTEKMDAPSIAQAGLMLQLWDIKIFCDDNGLSEEETISLMKEFNRFHEKQMRCDLKKYLKKI